MSIETYQTSRLWTALKGNPALAVSILSLIVAVSGFINTRQQISILKKTNTMDLKPDIHSRIEYPLDDKMTGKTSNPHLVIWNDGPLKPVAVTVEMEMFAFNKEQSKLVSYASGAQHPSKYLITRSEIAVGQAVDDELIAAHGARAVYVIRTTFYREKDMEKFTREDVFLTENHKVLDHGQFRQVPEYFHMLGQIEAYRKSPEYSGISDARSNR